MPGEKTLESVPESVSYTHLVVAGADARALLHEAEQRRVEERLELVAPLGVDEMCIRDSLSPRSYTGALF